MTTNVQIPYIGLVGDGSLTRFTFEFSLIEHVDLKVLIDKVLQTQYSEYTIESDNPDIGGTVVFVEAPATGAKILIIRNTTKSQNVDYTANSFPAETHEWNLDKITFILQELITGAWLGIDDDGNIIYLTFNLTAIANVGTVTIDNSGGTNAEIPAWVSALTAGVYHGEVGGPGSAPADNTATQAPEGYIWIEHDGA